MKATSIAHIAQAQQAADDAYNRALTAIEEAVAPPPTPDPTTVSPPPRVKKRRVVVAKELCSGSFIESNADMEAFLKKLRAELEAALNANERVQIK